jgi:PAS domain S-box-containing protein
MELEAKLSALSRSHAMIEFDMDGAVLFANDRFLSTFGYVLDEVVGRHHSMFVEVEDQKSAEYAQFWESLRRGEFMSGQYKRLGKGSREVWVQATYNPILDLAGQPFKVMKYASDITEAKLKNADSAAQIAAIGRSQAVIEFDLEGHVLWANDIFLKLFGQDLDAIVGRHHRLFVDPAEVRTPAYELFWSELRTGKLQSGEYRRRTAGGAEVWLQASYTPIKDLNGRPIKIVKFATDITEAVRRKHTEAELERARLLAEAAAAAKGDFLATMSHELRTPLTSILGFSRLLGRNGELCSADRKHVDLICRAGETLLQVVNDILDFSKLEAGAMTLSPEPFSTRALIGEVSALLDPQASAKGLSIQCDMDEDIALLADSTRLRQVLLNIVGNAIKFTERGDIHIRMRTPAIDAGRHRLDIDVTDSGIGIPPEEIGRLFQRFTQVDATTARRFGGTGLGLAISKQLVEGMGGRIEAESDGAHGSTFRLSIPLESADEAVASPVEPEQASLSDRRLRILFADDHPANRLLVNAMLDSFDIELDLVENGLEAVQAAEKTRYDVILMDVNMPVMDGPTAAAAIRAKGDSTPIIALSANILPEQVETYVWAGMQGHVAKPIEISALIGEIAKHCQSSAPMIQAA